MVDGYIKLPRALMTYPELGEHDAFYVLYMILSLMRFRESYMDGVQLEVNQFSITKKELALRCRVDIRRLKYILSTFERAGGIRTENNRNRTTIITVLDRYLPDKGASQGTQTENKRRSFKKVVGQESLLYKDRLTDNGNCDYGGIAGDDCVAVGEGAAVGDALQSKKRVYGTFRNVYLTCDETVKLNEISDKAELYVESLSSYLAQNSNKAYDNHFAALVNWITRDKIEKATEKEEEEERNSHSRSYDLKRAEEMARKCVPKLKKREEPPLTPLQKEIAALR